MSFCALLSAVEAGIVWLPAALYLVISAATWKAAILIAFGMLVIGLVDNLLWPVLIVSDPCVDSTFFAGDSGSAASRSDFSIWHRYSVIRIIILWNLTYCIRRRIQRYLRSMRLASTLRRM